MMLKKCFGALLIAALITGCGGGSPSVPSGSGGGSGGGGGNNPAAADLIVNLDKVNLLNSGSDSVKLTVTALDGSRNAMSGIPVSVAVDNHAVFTPSATTTDGSGNLSGQIGIGDDKSNRLIHYTVTSGTLTKNGAVNVSGVALAISAVPSNPQPGVGVTLTVKVTDSSKGGIPNTSVSLSGLPGVTVAPATTDSNGNAIFNFNAPATIGVYSLQFDSAGMSNSYDLQVLPSGASLPPATGPVTAASSIANPVTIGANTSNSTTNQSEIRTLFYTQNNLPIQNMRVRFSIVSSSLTGESLSSGSNVVYSDTTGAAKVNYIAGTIASPTNGVVIRACYSQTDFSSLTDCPKFIDTTLTVTSNPVNLTIGTDNKISKSTSGISYVKAFEVQAVNSAGQAMKDVQLSAVVDIQGYWKGASYSQPPSRFDDSYGTHLWCINEDINRNGILDTLPTTEDINGDGFLTPRQSDAAVAFVSGVSKTDANGLAQIQLTYPQNLAGWERVKITVTAGVTGSEGAASYVYVLAPSQDDMQNGSFLSPPYGSDIGSGDPVIDQQTGHGCYTYR